MIYVMSDIHGQAGAFYKMLKKICFSDNDQMYVLGDVIDRGPDGRDQHSCSYQKSLVC